MTDIKVSVVTVTYNHESFIEECVRSVLSQRTDFLVEHVVGDDCSTDGTRAILEKLAEENHPSLNICFRRKNLGAHNNFREVFASARGEYIAFLEGDDYWTDPTKLQQQVEILDRFPQYSICFHRAQYVDVNNRLLGKIHPSNCKQLLTTADLIAANPITTNSILLRRAMLPEIPEFIKHLKLGDWPITITASRNGAIYFIDKVMSAYRIHHQSTWSSKSLTFRRRATLQMYVALVAAYPDLEPLICDAILRSIDEVESSLSYRIGFSLTAPLRWLRSDA